MSKRTSITTFIFSALAVALITGCGGGASTPSSPTTAPSASPSANPSTSANPSASPSSAPSAAPTPQYAFPAPTATMPSSNATVTLTQGALTLTATFSANTAGSGTINVNAGFNTGDITPAISPADNATSGFTPLIYLSFDNNTTNTISFGSSTPKVVITSSGAISGANCNLDVYSSNGGMTSTWNFVGATGPVTGGNSVTIAPSPLGSGMTVDFKPGQQIVAISCK